MPTIDSSLGPGHAARPGSELERPARRSASRARLRLARGSALAASILLLSLASPAADASSLDDSVVAVATAGPGGAGNVHLSVLGRAYRTTGVRALGFGIGSDDGGHFDIYNLEVSGASITTGNMLGAAKLEVSPPAGSGPTLVGGTFQAGRVEEGESIAVAVFVTGMVFDAAPRVSVVTDEGSVTVRSSTARGARVFSMSNHGTGAIVGAGGIGGGAMTEGWVVPTGIAGGFEPHACVAVCTFGGLFPGGAVASTVGTSADGSTYSSGSPNDFAGPAGEWIWNWNGLARATDASMDGVAIVGGFMPVGDDWPLFATPVWPGKI